MPRRLRLPFVIDQELRKTMRIASRVTTAIAAVVAAAGITAFPVHAPSASAATVVSTSAQLQSALSSAKPGQVIQLGDGRYTGKFKASASGTATAPITLIGSRAAVLSTGSTSSGYALHLTGSHWRVSGISVTTAQKGIMLDNSDQTVISGVDVGNIGHEGIHVRKGSSRVLIQNSSIHDVGKTSPGYGEGIYVGSAKSNWGAVTGSSSTPDRSDQVSILGNRISNTTAEGIDVKEGTTGGTISGNIFTRAGYSGANYADSWIDVKGNKYTVSGNSGSTARMDAIQVHRALSGWGGYNVFSGNGVVTGVPGFEVKIDSATPGNVVYCKASGASRGLTNVPCR